jgi:hypothetical protein
VVAGALFAAHIVLPGHAWAFRTIADLPDVPDDQRVRWEARSFDFAVYESVPHWLPVGSLADAAQRAFHAWTQAACVDLTTTHLGLSQAAAELGDGINTVQVVTDGWEARGHRADAAGATELDLLDEDGTWVIREADILINAEHHEFSLSEAPADGQRSLLTTLRHEAGHALGLLHPCEIDGESGAPTCDANSVAEETIMYPFYDPGQSELLPDDYAAICFLYPTCEADGCPEGFACTANGCLQVCDGAVCDGDQYCVEGRCLSEEECAAEGCFSSLPEGFLGCERSEECPSAVCHLDGSCAAECTRDSECDEGSTCVFSSDPNELSYCGPTPLSVLGEPCEESADCADGECLAGAQANRVCTRICGGDQPECPDRWSCDEVDGRSVCVPPRKPRGCAFVSQRFGEHSGSTLLSSSLVASCVLLGLLRAFTRRRGVSTRS